MAEGFASRAEDAALEAFATADGIARSGGNRWMSVFAHTEASGLLVARGAVAEGCEGLAEMLALWFRAGDWSQQWHTLSRCVIALHRIGNPELAMELVGAIETYAQLGVAPMTSILHDVVYDTRDTLVRDLGDTRASELRAAGAVCPVDEIVGRTRPRPARHLTRSGVTTRAEWHAAAARPSRWVRRCPKSSVASVPRPAMRLERRRRRNGRPRR